METQTKQILAGSAKKAPPLETILGMHLSWRERHFILQEEMKREQEDGCYTYNVFLYYYRKRKNARDKVSLEEKGSIGLASCTSITDPGEPLCGFENIIDIQIPGRTHHLAFSSSQEKMSWLQTLTSYWKICKERRGTTDTQRELRMRASQPQTSSVRRSIITEDSGCGDSILSEETQPRLPSVRSRTTVGSLPSVMEYETIRPGGRRHTVSSNASSESDETDRYQQILRNDSSDATSVQSEQGGWHANVAGGSEVATGGRNPAGEAEATPSPARETDDVGGSGRRLSHGAPAPHPRTSSTRGPVEHEESTTPADAGFNPYEPTTTFIQSLGKEHALVETYVDMNSSSTFRETLEIERVLLATTPIQVEEDVYIYAHIPSERGLLAAAPIQVEQDDQHIYANPSERGLLVAIPIQVEQDDRYICDKIPSLPFIDPPDYPHNDDDDSTYL